MILTKLTKKDFDKILENYNIGKYKSDKNIFTGTNTIYILNTTKGKFLLKIFENAKLNFIKDQIRLMEFLKKTKVSTPKIINSKKGKGLLIYHKKKIVIQEFVVGREPKQVSKKLAQDIGKKFGILDKTLLKYKNRNKDDWKKDHEFKLIKWKINKIDNLNPKKESKKLFKEINTINKNKLRKSVIHGDLNEVNILTSKDKLKAIIDWDDFHKDYLIYEIAVPISHIFITERTIKKDMIRIFLREYQKQIKLNPDEKKALYYFIKQRILESSSWCINQLGKHKDKKKELITWATSTIKRYKIFNKITLEEFLKIIK